MGPSTEVDLQWSQKTDEMMIEGLRWNPITLLSLRVVAEPQRELAPLEAKLKEQ